MVTPGASSFRYWLVWLARMMFWNSSPSMFSFSISTSATLCSTSMLVCRQSLARRYARSTSSLTSLSIAAAVSAEKSLGCAICAPRNDCPPPLLHATWPSDLTKPSCVTIMRAVRDTCWKSPLAPVVMSSSPKMSSSAMRPPSATHIWFSRYWRLYSPLSRRSSLGAKNVRPPAAPRGTIEILVTGSYSGIRAPTMAWPASWYATSLRFFSDMTAPFFSGPATMRSRASAISSLEISLSSRRAARMAASFIRFCRSAPVKPGVRRAIFSRSTSLDRILPLACTFKISTRPWTSGRSTVT
mmetsp:Transcript_28368/g.61709  ORF Transcript_28368/g.61709 Transcript_28368/m.61709 type:complete len:299 (-) Transcript_28368:25-921(-)